MLSYPLNNDCCILVDVQNLPCYFLKYDKNIISLNKFEAIDYVNKYGDIDKFKYILSKICFSNKTEII